MISRTLIGAVAAVLLTLASGAATAHEATDAVKKQAQALQVEGLHLLQKGDNRGALDKFEAAFRLVPSPKILFNRAKAHRALGETAEAVADFERFLDEAPYAPKESRAEATRVVEALRPTLAYIEVQTEDLGAAITIDQHEIGAAPLVRPAVVVPGTHELRVAKPGMVDDVRSVAPLAGQKLRVVVKLSPVADRTPVAANPPARTTEAKSEPAVASSSDSSESDTPPIESTGANLRTAPSSPAASEGTGHAWQTTAAWVTGAVGVLFLGGGVTAHLLSSSKNADFNAVRNAPNKTGECNKVLSDDGGGPCKGLADAADQRLKLAIAGYVVSGVALVTSLVFYLSAPSSGADVGRTTTAACLPSEASGVTCALTMRF